MSRFLERLLALLITGMVGVFWVFIIVIAELGFYMIMETFFGRQGALVMMVCTYIAVVSGILFARSDD